MPDLIINNLNLFYKNISVLSSLSASFNAGQIIALVGHNGCGKSTLLHTLAGLKKGQGKIFLDTHEINSLTPLELSQKLTLLKQSSVTHPYALCESRIAQGLMPHKGYYLEVDKESHELICDIAQKLNISHLLKRPLNLISGGEQRLVNIAKCLVNQKISIILLDEPSVYLDFKQSYLLKKILTERAKSSLIIFASHDQNLIEECATEILFIDKNRGNLLPVHAFRNMLFNLQ